MKTKRKPKRISAFALCRVPLSPDEHRMLSNPPDVSLLALMEERATRQDLWTLWFRCACTLSIVKGKYQEKLPEVEPIALWMENFWGAHHRALTQTPISCSPEEVADLRTLIDFANEVQHETNREVMLQAYKFAHAYCIDKAKAIDEQRTHSTHATG